ncbi:MAG: hypothetical protein ACK4GW_10360 [Pseudorhodobacter sp.]
MDERDMRALCDLVDDAARGIASIHAVLLSADTGGDHNDDERWARDVLTVCALATYGLIPTVQGARCFFQKSHKQKDAKNETP